MSDKYYDMVYKWVIKEGRRFYGLPCLREVNGKCRVVDNAPWNAPVIAEGATWEEVANKLGLKE